MRNACPIVILFIVAIFAAACQSPPQARSGDGAADTDSPPSLSDRPIAYLDGQVVVQDQVYRLLAQSYGGEALAEILLDRAVRARLKQENLTVGPSELAAEKAGLLASLSTDADEAARLMRDMRSERGLNDKRFEAMLSRNAGLRLLVRDQVTINDAAIQQAYQLRYGPRYRVRLIVTKQLSVLTGVRRAVLDGASFTDEAIEHSTDRSASQGGLLSPISPADATYPKAIRDALPKLKMDTLASRLSTAIALDNGYALLWLEAIVQQEDPPTIEQARGEMETAVRADLERVRMRQLARTLIDQANVVVLDPALEKSWRRQKDSTQRP